MLSVKERTCISQMVALDSTPGSCSGRGHFVVFFGRTLYSRSASLQPGYPSSVRETRQNFGVNLRWSRIAAIQGEKQHSLSPQATETGISPNSGAS